MITRAVSEVVAVIQEKNRQKHSGWTNFRPSGEKTATGFYSAAIDVALRINARSPPHT